MRVLFILLILFQTAVPAICLAGGLEHHCSDDCSKADGCDHESNCPDDPCSTFLKVVGSKVELIKITVPPAHFFFSLVTVFLFCAD